MKRTIGFVFLSVIAVAFLVWMLTTPLLKINDLNVSPAVADGGGPIPPPPWNGATSFSAGVLLADGGGPIPPPPWNGAMQLAAQA